MTATSSQKSILFVCLGNICRSPLAEGIMRHIQQQYGLNLKIDSAGTSSYHTNEAPDPRTQQNAKKHGVDLSSLRARTFVKEDLETFAYIYVMDKSNRDTLANKFQTHPHFAKIKLLPHPASSAQSVEIPDPSYGSEREFEAVVQLIYDSRLFLCAQLSMS